MFVFDPAPCREDRQFLGLARPAQRVNLAVEPELGGKARHRADHPEVGEERQKTGKERQIVLDNVVAGGRNGYEILTPFRTGNSVVIVNRGWVAAHPDRRVLPTVTVGNDTRTISGSIQHFKAPGLRLEQDTTMPGSWPHRMLFPDAKAVATVLDQPVEDFVILLSPDTPDGYLRDWRPVNAGPEKHYGYFFQWVSFAVLAVLFYFILIWRWFRRIPSAGANTTGLQK